MSRLKGNLLLSLAPPGDRTPSSSTSRRLVKGTLVWASVATTGAIRFVGELWVQINTLNLDTTPGIGLAVLTSGYLTDANGLIWQGCLPILEGDRVQIQAQSSVAGIQLYGDFRFSGDLKYQDK